jgi:hypothetical protein
MDAPRALDCYWVEPDRLLAGEYPGTFAEADTRERLRTLLECGIRTFVDLTEEDEWIGPYDGLLQAEAATLGVTVTWSRLPIRDMSVPNMEGMRGILDTIARAIAAGSPVYLHCLGGIGRTGTVVACWLAERGLAGDDVFVTLARLREGRGRRRSVSPETPAQFEFARAWCSRTSLLGGARQATRT